jgi:hypothetical protein
VSEVEFLSDLNAWIKNHIELIGLIVIPLLTFLVTQISNAAAEKRSTKSLAVERRLAVELKLVEFRQDWINALRNDLADFISAAGTPDVEGSAARGISAMARINLRLNPKDPDFDHFIDRMHDLSSMIHSAKDKDTIQAWGLANADLIDISQRILKREWDRLKADLLDAQK